MEVLGVLVALLALVAVPFVLLAVALKVLFALVLLPLKLVAASSRASSGWCSAWSAGSLACWREGSASSGGLLVLFVVLVLLPLAPLLLLGGLVWLALKAFSPAARRPDA